MSGRAARQKSPGLRMWAGRRRDRQGGLQRPRWWLSASILLLALLLSSGTGSSASGSLGALLWQRVEASASTPLETLGVSRPLRDPLALTGSRGIIVGAGLPEGRSRASQLVEPGVPSLAGGTGGPGHGLGLSAPRPALLAVGGLFAPRAPPAARA